MKDASGEPMSPDAIALLDAERAREGAPPDVRARLLERLARDLPDLAGGGSEGGDPGKEGSGGAPPAAPAGASHAGAVVSLGKAVALGGLGLALGGAMGIVAGRTVFAPAPKIVVVEKTIEAPMREPAPRVAALPPAVSADAPPSAPSALPPSRVASARASTPSPSSRDTDLAEERAALELARTALARGDAPAALAAAERHASKYPRGQLAEEREAIAVQALVALGRAAEAEARAARFKATYPRSMILPLVEQAVRHVP